jgi:hypothetical protein
MRTSRAASGSDMGERGLVWMWIGSFGLFDNCI